MNTRLGIRFEKTLKTKAENYRLTETIAIWTLEEWLATGWQLYANTLKRKVKQS